MASKRWMIAGIAVALMLSGGSVYAAAGGKTPKAQDPQIAALEQQVKAKEAELKTLKAQLNAKRQEISAQQQAEGLKKLQDEAAKLGIDATGKTAGELKLAIVAKRQEFDGKQKAAKQPSAESGK